MNWSEFYQQQATLTAEAFYKKLGKVSKIENNAADLGQIIALIQKQSPYLRVRLIKVAAKNRVRFSFEQLLQIVILIPWRNRRLLNQMVTNVNSHLTETELTKLMTYPICHDAVANYLRCCIKRREHYSFAFLQLLFQNLSNGNMFNKAVEAGAIGLTEAEIFALAPRLQKNVLEHVWRRSGLKLDAAALTKLSTARKKRAADPFEREARQTNVQNQLVQYCQDGNPLICRVFHIGRLKAFLCRHGLTEIEPVDITAEFNPKDIVYYEMLIRAVAAASQSPAVKNEAERQIEQYLNRGIYDESTGKPEMPESRASSVYAGEDDGDEDYDYDDDGYDDYDDYDGVDDDGGLLTGLAAAAVTKYTRDHRQHGAACTCPKCVGNKEHYGYRYGRWYYGHNHTDGCETGEDNCDGGSWLD